MAAAIPRSTTTAQARVAFIGMPNTGKSTLFNALSGSHAHIGNWPGLTVDLMQADLVGANNCIQLIDLPGIYDLRGLSEDEAVVRRFLEGNALQLVVLVLNANQLDRQLRLALQLQILKLPLLVALNMSDEAHRFGVEINTGELEKELGCPVVAISAKQKQGLELLSGKLVEAAGQEAVALATADLEILLAGSDATLEDQLEQLVSIVVELPPQWGDQLSQRLDGVLMHPLWGLPIFFSVMALMFEAIYALGIPLQDALAGLLTDFGNAVLRPLADQLPSFWSGLLIEGLWQGLATVTAFLPVIFLFFLVMGVIEDSGYLSRSAYLVDFLMERLGLDGRSFVLSLMGFGCNVPAIMGTRVMGSRGLRLLSMLVIPFSLCSARLNVFLFMASAMFAPAQAGLVIFSLYLVSFSAALLTAALFKGQFDSQEALVLELPPYRLPTPAQMFTRAWAEVRHFWFWARRYLVVGVIGIWLLNNLPVGVAPASAHSFSGQIGEFLQPVLGPAGINPKLTVALLFGFIAKEIVLGGMAVIYGQSDAQALGSALAAEVNWIQAYSFMLFTLLYTPCLSTVAVIQSEAKDWRFTALSLVWSLGLAWLVSFLFYQGCLFLNVG